MEITHEHGLHLKAAHRLVRLAKNFQSDIRLFFNDRVANGRSILDLVALGAMCGAVLELEVIGPDSEEASAALSELFQSSFNDHETGSRTALHNEAVLASGGGDRVIRLWDSAP
jgi:phosphotransferase system HPr (HPr) family protein